MYIVRIGGAMRTLSYDPLWNKLIDLKLSKTELAEKAGISRGIITRMGKSKMVTLDAVLKICQALDCDVYDVVAIVPDYDSSGNESKGVM